MPDRTPPLSDKAVRFRIYVPRLWGWVPTGPTFASRSTAGDWLTQLGPSDGVVRRETRA